MQVPKINVIVAKKVAEEVYALNRRMKAGERVTKQELIGVAWRLANLVTTIEQKPVKLR